MSTLYTDMGPDLAPSAPLDLTMEAEHLEVAVYALSIARTVAQRSFLARSPFSAGGGATRTLGLMQQAETRLKALSSPAALLALNLILRGLYEAGQVAPAESSS